MVLPLFCKCSSETISLYHLMYHLKHDFGPSDIEGFPVRTCHRGTPIKMLLRT